MTQVQILEELKKFTIPDRLTIVEATLRLIREDLQQKEQPLPWEERRHQLAVAAEALLPDYAAGGELSIESDRPHYRMERSPCCSTVAGSAGP